MRFTRFLAPLGLALGATACLATGPFRTTLVQGEESIVGAHDYDGVHFEVGQQVLTDRDFWGERPGGFRFNVYATNTNAAPACVYVAFQLADRAAVRQLDHRRGWLAPVGRRQRIGLIHMREDVSAPPMSFFRAPDLAWRAATDDRLRGQCLIDGVIPETF